MCVPAVTATLAQRLRSTMCSYSTNLVVISACSRAQLFLAVRVIQELQKSTVNNEQPLEHQCCACHALSLPRVVIWTLENMNLIGSGLSII